MYNNIATSSIQGTVGNWKGYDIQTVSLQPGDVILVHVSDNLDLDDCQQIMENLREIFPNNQTVLCNEHILKGMTIIRPEKTSKINDKVDITSVVDVDTLFSDIF